MPQDFTRLYYGTDHVRRVYRGSELPPHWEAPAPTYIPGPVVSTNIATEARGRGSAPTIGFRSTRWYGGGGTTGGYRAITDAADGPTPDLTSYRQKYWTIGVESAAGGDTGFDLMSSGITVSAGQRWWMAGWVRSSRVGRLIYCRCTATKLDGTSMGSNISLPGPLGQSRRIGDGWEWFIGYYDVPEGVERINLRIDSPGDLGYSWRTGDTLDGTGLYIGREEPTQGFFDGDSPDDNGPGYTYDFVTGTGPSTKRVRVEYP